MIVDDGLTWRQAVIHWYLEEIIFPRFMEHQRLKLSASGQELGGSMLFTSQRLGFSGTPSDLLPIDLGLCGYERGSDGKMLHVLTDESVMSVEFAPEDWTVDTLLHSVANAEPHFNALIDTGALITGLSNYGVAERLLSLGLSKWCEGVVFLDESDEKVILVKATMRVLKLSQCGVSLEQRFAFYDQIHTTGSAWRFSKRAPSQRVLLLRSDVRSLKLQWISSTRSTHVQCSPSERTWSSATSRKEPSACAASVRASPSL